MARIIQGDNLDVLRKLIAEGVRVHAVITDPPQGKNVMGRGWDAQVPSGEFWNLVYKVLKPGANVLSFGATRTYHRMVSNMEYAGFEIRDMLTWNYGRGMPKSVDVSKAIDKAAGARRKIIGTKIGVNSENLNVLSRGSNNDPNAKGLGAYGVGAKQVRIAIPVTAPATPDATSWQGWGTGLKPALEPIVLARKPFVGSVAENVLEHGTGALNIDGCRIGSSVVGRWPSGAIFDEEAAALLEQQSAGASRFFYCAKASAKERRGSKHPCIKPLMLMRWLCRLIKPRGGGTILDPFAGSGATGEAARLEGCGSILIERESEYIKDIEIRLAVR